MFEFTETVHIQATANEVWSFLENVERWWLPSNPEHMTIEVRSRDKSIHVGTEITFEERIAGVKAKAEGAITRLVPATEAAWEGAAEYRYFGLRFRVREGVSWQLAADGEATVLSAQVWARFPPNISGRVLEWYARTILGVVERDRAHARCELEYLKRTIEDNGLSNA